MSSPTKTLSADLEAVEQLLSSALNLLDLEPLRDSLDSWIADDAQAALEAIRASRRQLDVE